ncbi:hypothetical protein V8G69_08205 [Gaetbulibacter sp. M235]|uniref:hypothetical protein n=1 Tax=Gaetbulibacter sp. M235 TaxID=3126510 RepID=UPI00374F1077
MKKITFLLLIILTSISCKQNKETQLEIKTKTVAEKIADANGFDNWKNISKIEFTFNVDRDSSHFERSWSWKPKTDDIILISDKDTISYNRNSVDSLSLNADKSFINDKYWLLAPFQLSWDTGTTITEASKAEAPISKALLNKITLTYPNEGGYTPGDAYDFYFGDDYLIKEWVYRKENSEKPSLITTWENYQDFNGIKLGLNHKKPEGNWMLYFSNVKVE